MIREQDLRIDIYRTAGPPAANNEVAVRITHLPTGFQGIGRDAENASAYKARHDALRELLPKLRAAGITWGTPKPLPAMTLTEAIREVAEELDREEEE